MTITYHGHSTFRLRGKNGTVITDPYTSMVGFDMPALAGDIVTTSHDHADHNAVQKIKGTSRRKNPFIISKAGEYEVGGISVFGVQTYHDTTHGAERGSNIIFTILIDEVRVCHLGDLGHSLTEDHLEDIGDVDVLLCPVGGVFSIGGQVAVQTIRAIDPRIIIPMHFKTPQHDQAVFGDLHTVEEFVKEYGVEAHISAKLDVEKTTLPEETELLILDTV